MDFCECMTGTNFKKSSASTPENETSLKFFAEHPKMKLPQTLAAYQLLGDVLEENPCED